MSYSTLAYGAYGPYVPGMQSDDFVFEVRGIPVRFRCEDGRSGWLSAVQRGYFPCSETGYRSLASLAGQGIIDRNHVVAVAEEIAVEQDATTTSQLREAESLLRDLPRALSSSEPFDGVGWPVSCALTAVGRAVFRTADVRERFLRIALKVFTDLDLTFSARSIDYSDCGVWNEATVAESMSAARTGIEIIRALLAGDNDRTAALNATLPRGRSIYFGSFLSLPDAPEPIVEVPVGETLAMFA